VPPGASRCHRVAYTKEKTINTAQARELGKKCAALVAGHNPAAAAALLQAVLAERTPFRLLDQIGAQLSSCTLEAVDPFLDLVAEAGKEGGWVVIASTLRTFLGVDLEGVLARCRRYVILANVWYGADSIAERVPGEALIQDYNGTLVVLQVWCGEENAWVRRAVGVAVHFWAKRSKGRIELASQAAQLLDLLAPLYSEQTMDAAKGIGWGLKTLGRFYPELVESFLLRRLEAGEQCRAVVLRKALKFLPDLAKGRIRAAAG